MWNSRFKESQEAAEIRFQYELKCNELKMAQIVIKEFDEVVKTIRQNVELMENNFRAWKTFNEEFGLEDQN